MKNIPYPKGLRLKILKNAEKFSSIATAIDFILLRTFYSFLSFSKF